MVEQRSGSDESEDAKKFSEAQTRRDALKLGIGVAAGLVTKKTGFVHRENKNSGQAPRDGGTMLADELDSKRYGPTATPVIDKETSSDHLHEIATEEGRRHAGLWDVSEWEHLINSDHIEFVGIDDPFSTEVLNGYIDSLNSQEVEIEEDTYYSTIFVSETAYYNYEKKHGSVLEFVANHEAAMNHMLERSHREVASNHSNYKVRRVILVQDDTEVPDVYFPRSEIVDSDGGWFLDPEYDVDNIGYYNQLTGIDGGLLHELGHSTFHLWDTYNLDTKDKFQFPDHLSKSIPEQWAQGYNSIDRSDYGPDFMNNAWALRINRYTGMELGRRVERGTVHEKFATGVYPETAGPPYEFPENITFSFTDLEDGTVEVYKSAWTEDRSQKTLQKLFDSQLVGGETSFGQRDLFEMPTQYGNLNLHDSVFFVRVRENSGHESFRWLDARDFNIAHWEGYAENVKMWMKTFDASDYPGSFDWTIDYQEKAPPKYLIPQFEPEVVDDEM